MAYQGLVESPSTEVSQLMVTNPLRFLKSGQPVLNVRTRSASIPTNLISKPDLRSSLNDDVIKHETATLPRPNSILNKFDQSDHKDDNNPIPLPPRDRNKVLLTAKPRHTRKHPLIIPPTSLQRTLDKVNTVSPPANESSIEPFSSEPHYTNNNVQLTDKNTESIHFEAEIESNLNALDEIPPEQDVVDGENATAQLGHHHVSCEDLLKFANAKPSSRARGNDSDEVRIMSKVLGKDIGTEKCLQALDETDWDVMKAIKIVKLNNVVNTVDLTMCFNALEQTGWDVTKAAQWVLQQANNVTQV